MILKNKNLNVILSLSLALLTITWLTVLPQRKELHELAKKISTEKNELTQLNEQGKNIKELRNQLEKYKKDSVKLENIFLYQNNEIEFITTLEKVASKNGVEQTINLSEPKNSDNNLLISELNLVVFGKFDQIIDYLEDLESLDYYLNPLQINLINNKKNNTVNNIPTLNIGANNSEKNQNQLRVELNSRVYWQ